MVPNLRELCLDWASLKEDQVTVNFGFAGTGRYYSRAGRCQPPFLRLGEFRLRYQLRPSGTNPLAKSHRMIVSGERIKAGNVQCGTGIRQYLVQLLLAAWRCLDQAPADHRHGVRREPCWQRLCAFPLAFIAARNIMPNFFANQITKRFLRFSPFGRYADLGIVLSRAPLVLGPLAGISAIFLHRYGYAWKGLFRNAGKH